MRYPVVRFFLGIAQVIGWILAVLVAMTGLLVLRPSLFDVVQSIVAGIFLGGINHAFCGLGLAILDLIERYLAKNPWPSELKQHKQMLRDDGPQAAPMPALIKPIPREHLLEDGSATPAPTPLTVTGDLAPSRPLGEDDLARLEAEQKRRAKR